MHKTTKIRNHRLTFEPLEDRRLLTLIGITAELPMVVYNFQSEDTLTYEAASDSFDIDATPVAIMEVPNTRPRFMANTDLQIHIKVDDAGQLTGETDGDDLTLIGDVDVDGDGVPDASGILLTGEISQFGHLYSGHTGEGTDSFDFRFTATGGALVTDIPYFAGKDIGVTTSSEQSNFTGSFTEDFYGSAKGEIGPIEPVITIDAEIDIEKYVKELEETGGEGLTPGFWKQCQHFYAWTDYKPCDSYEETFGVDVPCDPSLLNALYSRGGGEKALMRHSTAALLNAAHANVDYAFTQSEIIVMVQNAFAAGEYEGLKDQFAVENEKGADLCNGSNDGGATIDDLGEDADEPTGPVVEVGENVVFTYVVTNPGDVPIAGVVVTDDNQTPDAPEDDFNPTPVESNGFNVGDTDMDGQLDPGERWIYEFVAIVEAGQHVNVAEVVGTPVDENGSPVGSQVTDVDPAHWFGELPPEPASVAGYVYVDANDNGIKDSGERGICKVKVTLTGDNGTQLTLLTKADGSYKFDNLLPGMYQIGETQPSRYSDGRETVGTAGGTAAVDDVFAGIALSSGTDATGYLFGELNPWKPDICGCSNWLSKRKDRRGHRENESHGCRPKTHAWRSSWAHKRCVPRYRCW